MLFFNNTYRLLIDEMEIEIYKLGEKNSQLERDNRYLQSDVKSLWEAVLDLEKKHSIHKRMFETLGMKYAQDFNTDEEASKYRIFDECEGFGLYYKKMEGDTNDECCRE